jgi:gentisate 1,2-dioxygenase
MAAVVDPGLARLSKDAAALGMKPLWERVARLAPGTAAQPAIWRWSDTRPLLMRACELISARQAERRVLMLENPALAGTTFSTTTLFTGLQAILPGEIAPTHRHTPNALRLIIEGDGAYTAVDGERIAMNPGDFIVTPGWSWHDHGNEGAAPVIWLDGLDTALANLFGAHFREDYPEDKQVAAASDSVLSYPYERTRAALERMSKGASPHPSHGFKLRYLHPASGRDPFPTMAVFMQRLPRGFSGEKCRSTDSSVYCVVEGEGRVDIGDTGLDFAPHDIFAVPSWEVRRFSARTDCMLFSYSDRAAQEALGFWREA